VSKTERTREHLEVLLRQLPKVTDNRDPHDLYHQISAKMNRKKGTGWLVPSLASIAALILFFILAPGLTGSIHPSNQNSGQESKSIEQSEDPVVSLKMDKDKSDQSGAFQYNKHEMAKTAVYKEDLQGKEILIYGIPDSNAMNIAPVSVLVAKKETKSWFDQFIETMPKLLEEKWGLSDYFPLKGTLTFNSEEKVVNIDLPSDHQYGWGSANELTFQNSLKTSFGNRSEVNRITFSTMHKPGIILGNDELLQIDLTSDQDDEHPYLLLYTKNQGRPLLVPMGETAASPEAAFAEMRRGFPTQGLKASIPEEFQFDKVVPNNRTLTINIRKGVEIPQTPEMMYGLEAILLTAKEFGFTAVEIKNGSTDHIGPFHLDQPIEVPVAPNKHEI
jgi:hypothetical protein